jgi:hypothetical protein
MVLYNQMADSAWIAARAAEWGRRSVAEKGQGEIQFPSSALVKYLNIIAAALGIVSIVLDAVVPVAQQVGKRQQAKEGLESAIRMTIMFAIIRTVPRLFREVRKLRAQLDTQVAQ